MTTPSLRILITGASGFIGTALTSFLKNKGHEVIAFKRTLSMNLEGFDAIIHLAGENIAKGFWTKKKKQKILESRVNGTKQLIEQVLKLQKPPKVFISTSAVGYYGTREDPVSEIDPPGTGFLADVCKAWESATKNLENTQTRLVIARFGYILSPQGGLLKTLLPLFRLGLGSKMGNGHQFMPWISLEDLLQALYHLIKIDTLQGAVNITSPYPVTQQTFAYELAKALKKPLFFSLPAYLLPGEKNKELILSSLQVIPKKLLESGYLFIYPKLSKLFDHYFQDFG